MAGLDVNGVGATQGTGASYEVKKQDSKEATKNSAFEGYGAASGGGQVDKPAFGVVNTYGGDVANFAKFKGNDKNDAMRLTNSAANDVKKQYMQLQHEYPGIELEFEPMPNPQTAGKKREGFFNYQQQLDNWKDNAMTQINNARERNTVEVVGDAVEAVNQNTNEKSAMNAALTAGYGEANLKATEDGVAAVNEHGDKNTGKIIANDNRNTKSIKSTVHARADRLEAGQKALSYQMEAGFDGVNKNIDGLHGDMKKGFDSASRENHAEHAKTRRAIKSDGEKSRATIQREADRVIDTLDPTGINRAIKGIRDMAAKAGKSVKEFIAENPNATIAVGAGLGIPVWAARKITSQM